MNHAVLKLIAHLKSEPWDQLLFERTIDLLKSEPDELAKQEMTLQLVDAIEIVNAEVAFSLLTQLVAAFPTHLPVLIKLKDFFNSSGKKAKAFAVELEIAKLQSIMPSQAPTVIDPPVHPPLPLNLSPQTVKLSWNDVAIAPSLHVKP